MNANSNAMSDFFESPAAPAKEISWTQRFFWLVQRELWEYRSLYIAPLAIAALFLIGFLISRIFLPQQSVAGSTPYDMAEGLIMVTGIIIAIYYSLDALHAERRDRSILFWKSLPVSDLITVLSKASIPIVIIQLLTFAITVVTHLMMKLLTFESPLPLIKPWTVLCYHLLAMHGLWYAPFYCWMLLVSAWARRAPLLWASLPLLAIGIFERIAFNTSYFRAMLEARASGAAGGANPSMSGNDLMQMMQIDPVKFFFGPGLWIGLAVAAAFLFAAVRVRRYRGPI